MGLEIIAFVIIFLLVSSSGLLLCSRSGMPKRDRTVIGQAGFQKTRGISSTLQQAGVSLGNIVGRFEGALPKSKAEASQTRQRFVRAGYRNRSAVKMLWRKVRINCRACSPGSCNWISQTKLLRDLRGTCRWISGARFVAGK